MPARTRPYTPLASARLDRGLSQRQLALLTGVELSTIARIESRAFLPRITTAFALADALDVTVDELFREEVERAKAPT